MYRIENHSLSFKMKKKGKINKQLSYNKIFEPKIKKSITFDIIQKRRKQFTLWTEERRPVGRGASFVKVAPRWRQSLSLGPLYLTPPPGRSIGSNCKDYILVNNTFCSQCNTNYTYVKFYSNYIYCQDQGGQGHYSPIYHKLHQ